MTQSVCYIDDNLLDRELAQDALEKGRGGFALMLAATQGNRIQAFIACVLAPIVGMQHSVSVLQYAASAGARACENKTALNFSRRGRHGLARRDLFLVGKQLSSTKDTNGHERISLCVSVFIVDDPIRFRLVRVRSN